MTESQPNSSMDEPVAKKLKVLPKSFADLPTYLIENILSYCFRDRHLLKTVCKAFYEAIWKIHGDNYTLSLDVNDEETLSAILSHSIINCRPIRFANIRLYVYHHDDHETGINRYFEMKNIFVKFLETKGEFVKNLDINDIDLTYEIQPLLSYMKNLTELSFRIEFSLDEEDSLDLSDLKKLRHLKVHLFCGSQVEILRSIKLPEGSVQIVRISGLSKVREDILCVFLEPVRDSIKHLQILFETHRPNYEDINQVKAIKGCSYKNLKLESLHISNASDEVFRKIFTSQLNLTVLELREKISNETLEKITSYLHQLKHLSANLSSIRPENFDNLCRLRNLKVLKVCNTDLEQLLLSDSELDVSELHLCNCKIPTVDTTRCLIQKFAKLIKLNIDGAKPLVIQEILEKCRQLEEIDFRSGGALRALNVPNEKLKTLSNYLSIGLDINFLRSFPNLTELSLNMGHHENYSFMNEIEEIFRVFLKLKKVRLKLYGTLRVKFDILALVNGHSNLQLIYFQNIDFDASTIENIKPERFEICQLEGGEIPGYSFLRNYSLLIATTVEVLMKSKEFITRYEYKEENIYYKALNYVNKRIF